jgi:predicted O-linked N-acetylglucosamine transferase (SPINDLY family)
LQIKPDFAGAYYNLGNVLKSQGHLNSAIECYEKVIQINPNYFDAYNNLGSVLRAKGQLDDAISCYQKALRLNPSFAAAYYNLGNTFLEQGRQDEALAAYDKALSHDPNFIKASWAKCMAQIPIIYTESSNIQMFRARYQKELVKLRDIFSLESHHDISLIDEVIGSIQPFYLAYQGLNDRDLQQIYGELVCKIMASKYPQYAARPTMPPQGPEKPLKIGVVSGFFYHHSVWKIPIKGWIENIDKNRFTLYGYHTGRKKDKETDIARHIFNRFVEEISSFEECCKAIREDGLHVLIYPEIGMDPMTVKLASLYLAPIQCASWGHPETSGLKTIDYYLSGDLMEPENAGDHYTEELIRLPNLSVYYSPLDLPCANVNRDTFGLRENSILYHCCQTIYKYAPKYDDIFPRIAQQVGNCQFIFSSYRKSGFVTEQFKIRIKKAFNSFDLNADDYVVFLPFLEGKKYNTLYTLSDIFLDPIGWSGCNSAFEAINYNLPVVTLPTMLMRGRESLAILTMMGITDTIAATKSDYIAIATRLGKDSTWRRYLSNKIKENKYLIYNDITCIRALEDFFVKVTEKSSYHT